MAPPEDPPPPPRCVDGALVLGRGLPTKRYTTRFRVSQRPVQSRAAWQEAAAALWPPAPRSLESDVFFILVFSLVILLQILKFSYSDQHSNTVHISLSVCETILTCGLLIVRLVTIRDKYAELRNYRNAIEHVHNEDIARHPEGGTTRRALLVSLAAGALFIAIDLICLVLLYATSNLHWMALPNNVGFVCMLAVSHTLYTHVDVLKRRITLDQHKLVLHEALMLLAAAGGRGGGEARLFCETIQGTQQFSRPAYITCPEDCKWDVITRMESGV